MDDCRRHSGLFIASNRFRSRICAYLGIIWVDAFSSIITSDVITREYGFQGFLAEELRHDTDNDWFWRSTC